MLCTKLALTLILQETLYSTTYQPRIVRLNESKHTHEVSDDGPKRPVYTPNI